MLKAIILGGPFGRTALRERISLGRYHEPERSTLGFDFTSIERRESRYVLQLFDVVSWERIPSPLTAVYRGTHIFLITFCLNRNYHSYRTPVAAVRPYIEQIQRAGIDAVPIILVGTQKDMKDISEEEITAVREWIKPISYVETSAITGEGIEELLTAIDRIALELQLTSEQDAIPSRRLRV